MVDLSIPKLNQGDNRGEVGATTPMSRLGGAGEEVWRTRRGMSICARRNSAIAERRHRFCGLPSHGPLFFVKVPWC